MKQVPRAILRSKPVAEVINRLHRVSSAGYQGDIFQKFELSRLFSNRETQHVQAADRFAERKQYILTDQPVDGAIRTLDHLSDDQVRDGLFKIYFTCDDDALPHLRRITALGGKYTPHMGFEKTDYRFTNRTTFDAMRRTWAKRDRVSHLTPVVHENICEAFDITSKVEGDYVEIGVFRGGSALTAINYLDERAKVDTTYPKRKAWLLDTFDGFNYAEAFESSDAIWAGTHALSGVDRTKAFIQETLCGTSVQFELVTSNICADELPKGVKKIAVANIDVDMFDPTRDAMRKTSPLIQVGGIMICEDAASTPGLYGAYQAMEDFLETEEGKRYVKIFKKGQYFLLKLR